MRSPISETFSRKRYVIQCLVCGCFDVAERTDKFTCSTSCRVKAHRTGLVASMRQDIARSGFPETTPGSVARVNALVALCPEFLPAIKTGELCADDPEVVTAVRDKLMALVRAQMTAGEACP